MHADASLFAQHAVPSELDGLGERRAGRREQHGVQKVDRGGVPEHEQAGEAEDVACELAQSDGSFISARVAWRWRPRRGSSRGPGGRRRRRGRACGRARPRSARRRSTPLSFEAGPACITPIRVARMTASSISCVMKSTVLPVARQMLGQLALHGGAGMRVERGERLVHQQHLRLVGQHARDLDALLHAAGQLGGMLVLLALQADELEIALCALAPLRRGTPRMRRPNSTLPSAVSHG